MTDEQLTGSVDTTYDLVDEPLLHPEPQSEVFEPGPAPTTSLPPLPLSSSGALHLIGRDPRWLFAFWDREGDALPQSCDRIEVRICTPDGAVSSSTAASADETYWLLPAPYPGGVFYAEIGWFAPEIGWRPIARSGIAQVAPSGPSADESAAFGLLPFSLAFDRLKALAAMAQLKDLSLPELLGRLADSLESESGVAPAEEAWTPEQRQLLKTLLDEISIERFAGDSSAIERLFRRGLQEVAASEEELFSRERWDHLLKLAGGNPLEGGS